MTPARSPGLVQLPSHQISPHLDIHSKLVAPATYLESLAVIFFPRSFVSPAPARADRRSPCFSRHLTATGLGADGHTVGLWPPNVAGEITEKSEVYSLGMVLLEAGHFV